MTQSRRTFLKGSLTLRPFAFIQDEHYRLYLKVEG